MTDQRRQELFRDAEPAADGGTFRVVVAMGGFAILVAVGWIAISLNEFREDLRRLQKDETRRVVVLSADVESLRRETQEEFNSVKNALSGVWHQHKPAELEVMGFLASLDPVERKSILSGLESLDSGKDSSERSISSSDRVDTEKPVLVSPAKPVLVSPANPGLESESSEGSEKNGSGGERLFPEGESPEEERGLPAEKAGGLEGGEQGSPGSPGAPDSSELERQAGGEAGESSVETREYVIQPGDSLSRIALKHGLSAGVLADANGITDPNKIRVGQVLKIPEE